LSLALEDRSQGYQDLVSNLSGAKAPARPAKGTAGQTLRMNAAATAPEWGGGAPNAIMEDQKASGINGGTFTSGAWRTRDLNTEVRDHYGLTSLAANQFTPTVAGWVEWSAPACKIGVHQSRLFNVTDGVEVTAGTSEKTDNGNDFTQTSTDAVRPAATMALASRPASPPLKSTPESSSGGRNDYFCLSGCRRRQIETAD
jgi:hypothetical protein